LVADLVREGLSPEDAARYVFNVDKAALDSCDLLLIVMDGRVIDEGAAFELGYAYSSGKRCFGLQTDVRRLIAGNNNPMIECACEVVFNDLDLMAKWFEACFTRPALPEFIGA
jgi:nucleoside 2-deoxyribosyltransferase